MTPFQVEAHVERLWPHAYFNPRRWDTIDGYLPWRVFYLYAAALYPMWAMDRLTTASAISLAFADSKTPDGKRAREGAVAEAYPLKERHG